MKELDFDELDRAVNTLMSDVPKTAELPSENDLVQTLTITPSQTNPTTTFQSPEPTGEPAAATISIAQRTTATPAARRGGRFMDVVHPSSDMKTASNGMSRTPSRQGVTIDSSVREPVAVPQETPSQPPDTNAAPAWPDPLDMAGYHREPDTTQPADHSLVIDSFVDELVAPSEVPLEPVSAIEAITPVDSIDVEEQPLTTPFLSDAKVVKRPLGTNTSDELDQAPATNATIAEVDVPDAVNQLSPTPVDAPVALPEELQGDLISIESGGDSELDDLNDVKPSQSVSTTAPAEALTGPSSIQQQYQEQPSTGDEKNGGIYDTANIHQPLAHPAKKKSGWMWIVWVVILLVLGAAGGAAAYLYLLK